MIGWGMDLVSQRLTMARQFHGLTKAALAEKLGVTTRSVSSYESSDIFSLRDETKEKLLSVLGFPLEFYFGDPLPMPTQETASFRAMARASARRKDTVLAMGGFGYMLDRWIEERFRLPQPDVPSMVGEDPQVAAESLRRHWQLAGSPIGDLMRLLESKGVRIYSLQDPAHGEARETSAYSDWFDNKPFIFINSKMSAERIRFTLAHELGHLILHDNQKTDSRIVEKEADAFASNFMMPADDFIAHAPSLVTIPAIVRHKKRHGVSAMAYVVRLGQLRLISDWLYRSTCAEMSHLGYRTHEPEGMPRETSLLLSKVFQHLRTQGTSKADIAAELHLPVSIIDHLIQGITVTALEGEGHSTPARRGKLHLVR